MRLKDKVALITGGAAGIGKATALRFAEEGARVAICDVDTKGGDMTLNELGPAAAFNHVDVTERASVDNWVESVLGKYGRIDILVNNAGIVRDSLLVKFKDGELTRQMPEDDFDLVVAINLKGVFNCTQAVVPAMIGMTKVWARELGRHNIRVNAVAPGFTATDIISSMPDSILDSMKKRTPLGRMGQPRDIANAYLFLASDEASFISGDVLRVDGGLVVGT